MENQSEREKLTFDVKIQDNATVVTGKTDKGKVCKLADNTGSVDKIELEGLLNNMIESQVFGIHAISSGDGIINFDKPRLSHIQIDDDLYRLYLFRYHAIIEKF